MANTINDYLTPEIEAKAGKAMKKNTTVTKPEIAFYYPGPVWHSGDWVKNLILFFDGIGLLVPQYMEDKPFESDPAIAVGLQEAGLLHIWQPEKIVDSCNTKTRGKHERGSLFRRS